MQFSIGWSEKVMSEQRREGGEGGCEACGCQEEVKVTKHPNLSKTKGFSGVYLGTKTRAVPVQANQTGDNLAVVPDRRERQNKGFEMGASLAVSGIAIISPMQLRRG